MPNFDIVREVCPKKSFRVSSVMGKFDLQSENIKEHFEGNIDLPEQWQIGLIIGKSGTGKTTIAKELFPKSYITNFKYNAETILDDMPENKSIEEISKTFNSVGFSSPPSWLKPYSVLSNGEKMRCDLATAILSDKQLFVFDEFTSVVDRQVAKIGSFAMQKAIRRTKKQFIAVTCHNDVEDWLLPDWIFDTDTMTFRIGQKKNKPALKFEIYETGTTEEKKHYWKMFGKYHYLNHSLNEKGKCYIGCVNNNPATFISIINFPHPIVKRMKKVHRLVTLPEYQGIGLGIKTLNLVGNSYLSDKWRFGITTSSPSLVFGLKNNNDWRCVFKGRMKSQSKSTTIGNMNTSQNRITTSWEYVRKNITSNA